MSMKMAKPSEADFNAVHDFLQGIAMIAEEGCLPVRDEAGEMDAGEDATGERVLEWIDAQWRGAVGGAWCPVLWAGKTAINNACDPAANTLEWKPEIKAALEAAAISTGKE